jgi:hypothetical protein
VAEAYTTGPNKERASKVLYIYLAWRVDRWDNKERYTYEPPSMRSNAVGGGTILKLGFGLRVDTLSTLSPMRSVKWCRERRMTV